MSVQEIIERVKELSPSEQREVQQALVALGAEAEERELAELKLQRAEEAWQRLEQGWCTTGGKNLSQNIDDALYRTQR